MDARRGFAFVRLKKLLAAWATVRKCDGAIPGGAVLRDDDCGGGGAVICDDFAAC